jgi:hypothetical protein
VVQVSSVEALDHELAGEPEVFAHFEGLLVYVLRREILCDAAVISVGEFGAVVLIIEEVVNINVVNVALDALQVDVLGLLLLVPASVVLCTPDHTIVIVSFFGLFLLFLIRVIFIRFL